MAEDADELSVLVKDDAELVGGSIDLALDFASEEDLVDGREKGDEHQDDELRGDELQDDELRGDEHQDDELGDEIVFGEHSDDVEQNYGEHEDCGEFEVESHDDAVFRDDVGGHDGRAVPLDVRQTGDLRNLSPRAGVLLDRKDFH